MCNVSMSNTFATEVGISNIRCALGMLFTQARVRDVARQTLEARAPDVRGLGPEFSLGQQGVGLAVDRHHSKAKLLSSESKVKECAWACGRVRSRKRSHALPVRSFDTA